MDTWSGYVDRIVYRSEDSGYSVIELAVDGELFTVTGVMADVEEGEFLEVTGKVVVHQVYGEQMQMTEYAHHIPEDPQLIARYLGSGMIKGIGEALAARIVKKFGADTIRIIEEEPERLAEVKGISMKSALAIGSQVAEKKDQRDAMMFLQQYGITPRLATKIYNAYGEGIYSTIRENPYRMTDDIYGIGFKTADEIAAKVGIAVDSEFRVRSGILHTLIRAEENGHTCLPLKIMQGQARELLDVPAEMIEEQQEGLLFDRRLVIRREADETYVYRTELFDHEMASARMLCDLNVEFEIDEPALIAKITQMEKKRDVVLDDIQREAVVSCIRHGVSVMTGGPGTGKTTTITILLDYFESEGYRTLLAAPTGRAAKRMSEATGRDASTVHRMLELTGVPDDERTRMFFARNDENPLDADVIVVDETSMVDIFLIRALLKAITVGTRLIFVGDVDQLPSVGPGNVLKDIIESGEFAVSKLTRIFRQSEDSDIVVNAHAINEGRQIDTSVPSKDFLFIKREQADVIISACITLMQQKLPKYVNADVSEIQVLTPMRSGALGVERLNKIFQNYLNPADKHKNEKAFGDRLFREGDKVMQIKNDYNAEWEVRTRFGIPIEVGMGVFNGDMGHIRTIDSFSEEIEIEFDEGRMVRYPFKNMDNIEHAYAITIHKSQGSEYPAVIVPLLTGPAMLMTRNLLYTAVTRAKQCVCIVGSTDMFSQMINNVSEIRRYSGLKECIERMSCI